MSRNLFASFLIVSSLVGGINAANGGVRNFFAPSMLGDRIAFCSDTSKACGKVVADQWCAQNGFEKALRFQRDNKIGAAGNKVMRAIDTGEIYTGKVSTSFRHIKCYTVK